jgi:hypothetical protein
MNWSGARQAIHDASCLHLLQRGGLDTMKLGVRVDRSAGSSSTSAILDQFVAAKINGTIERQRPMIRDWLTYAYTWQPSPNLGAVVGEQVYRMDFQRLRIKHAARRARIHRLCSLTVDDYRMRANSDGRTRLPRAYMAAELGGDESHWRRAWGAEYDTACRRLEEWDRIGLAAVSALLDELLERGG